MSDGFSAFSHWPRRARHAAIWALLLLMLAPLLHHRQVQPLQMQWQRIDVDEAPTPQAVFKR